MAVLPPHMGSPSRPAQQLNLIGSQSGHDISLARMVMIALRQRASFGPDFR
jgi:hypothetical protein